METYCIREKTISCLLKNGNLYDIIIEATNENLLDELIHQTIDVKKIS